MVVPSLRELIDRERLGEPGYAKDASSGTDQQTRSKLGFSDEEIERAARGMFDHDWGRDDAIAWEGEFGVDERNREQYRAKARAGLIASGVVPRAEHDRVLAAAEAAGEAASRRFVARARDAEEELGRVRGERDRMLAAAGVQTDGWAECAHDASAKLAAIAQRHEWLRVAAQAVVDARDSRDSYSDAMNDRLSGLRSVLEEEENDG